MIYRDCHGAYECYEVKRDKEYSKSIVWWIHNVEICEMAERWWKNHNKKKTKLRTFVRMNKKTFLTLSSKDISEKLKV